MIIDAQTKPGRAPRGSLAEFSDPRRVEPRITAHRLAWDAMLVVQVPGPTAGGGESCGRATIEALVARPEYAGLPLIVAVSDDVPLDDDELLLWGIFTRFDCARDIVPASTSTRGAWLTCRGPLGIDATWKAGYPEPVANVPGVIEQVSNWWRR